MFLVLFIDFCLNFRRLPEEMLVQHPAQTIAQFSDANRTAVKLAVSTVALEEGSFEVIVLFQRAVHFPFGTRTASQCRIPIHRAAYRLRRTCHP